ncbi:sigma factor-like helix-turn-helix DNA-binding protein [Asanoa siamensis]|uniref:RNA polymerase sigma factor 70 region 4 type 2 domain-containing protein n=1 Tax=Asanoa siamensis TaxID=926357 RepID=A0ABQ4D3Z9_9ACTN|nr:sigma factor-like helix-turn-helix DNA-binding protein [Asanoa siamensis]GIF78267.1 hypothetical protein Asi02nite_77850 [Asanoa siamensis]
MADDDGGFREFVDLRHGDLLRVAYLLTGSAHDAEDLSALRGLPPRTRVVVVRRYLDDMPETEVATLLGWPVGAVKSHASRGLARLRAALGNQELTKENR